MSRALREVDIAETILAKAREGGDYYSEKVAAKLLSFSQQECELIRHYVELKLYYPETASAIEDKKPYLLLLWQNAEETQKSIAQESGAVA